MMISNDLKRKVNSNNHTFKTKNKKGRKTSPLV